jgi:hypothetical protein
MELDRHNDAGAIACFLRVRGIVRMIRISEIYLFYNLPTWRLKTKISLSKNLYDSVNATPALIKDMDAFQQRKRNAALLLVPLSRIEREDSLQRVAGMPEAEREAYIRKLIKQLRACARIKGR